MDDFTILEILKTLTVDWSNSPYKIREILIKSGYSGISEKRIKRLKAERREQLCTFKDFEKAAVEIERRGVEGILSMGRYLEKISPKIVRALQSGELNPDLVGCILGYQMSMEDKKLGLVWDHDKFQVMVLSYLTREAFTLGQIKDVLTFGQGKVTYSVIEEEFLVSVETRLKREMGNILRDIQPSTHEKREVSSAVCSFVQALKKSFDETCASWEVRLDKHFQKGAGYFRKHCKLFDCSTEEFHLWMFYRGPKDRRKSSKIPEHREIFSFRNDAKLAAIDAATGIECTHCRVKIFANAKRCSQCKCVKYCSLACQKKDWKTHHRVLCAELTPMREAVDKAFDITQIHLSAGFNYEVDMMVRYWMATQSRRVFGDSKRSFTVENFHSNYKNVKAKKWWLCETNKHSWKQDWMPGKVVILEAIENQQFYQICYYMSQPKDMLSYDDYMEYFDSTPGLPLMTPGKFLDVYKLHSVGIMCLKRKQFEFRDIAEKFFFDSNSIHDLD